ncbi:MAG: hypothetical protein IPI72_10765 [Flavobacteriales bacterium]|nr:hypothetical protein [Flavobacteriales bacterium]
MSSDKPFRKISELVRALAQADQGLTAGTLGLEGLEAASNDAQELYERLVVLRHKAREATVAHAVGKKPEVSTAQEEEPGMDRPVRLDTRPAPEVSARQTSLIEAIEHTEQEQIPGPKMEPAPERAAKKSNKQAPSVAEKLEKAAVDDLNKAITLSHKFWFVAELFNGDRITYEKAIEQLNKMPGFKEAELFVETEVLTKLKKPADPDALSTFTELIQRRYT